MPKPTWELPTETWITPKKEDNWLPYCWYLIYRSNGKEHTLKTDQGINHLLQHWARLPNKPEVIAIGSDGI